MVFNILRKHGILFNLIWGSRNQGSVKINILNMLCKEGHFFTTVIFEHRKVKPHK